jgi:hypothetical protein
LNKIFSKTIFRKTHFSKDSSVFQENSGQFINPECILLFYFSFMTREISSKKKFFQVSTLKMKKKIKNESDEARQIP